jgi:hypothetical protein
MRKQARQIHTKQYSRADSYKSRVELYENKQRRPIPSKQRKILTRQAQQSRSIQQQVQQSRVESSKKQAEQSKATQINENNIAEAPEN